MTAPAWFDVTTYGADATGVADSYTAIKAAIAAAEAVNGGVIYFPKGTFSIGKHDTNSGIHVNSDKPLHFKGDGIGVSTIRVLAGSYSGAFFLLRFNNDNTTLSDFTFDGNRNNLTRTWTYTPTVQDSTLYRIPIDGVNYDYTSDASATALEICDGLRAAITTPGIIKSGTTTLILTNTPPTVPVVGTASANLPVVATPDEQTHFIQVEDCKTIRISRCRFLNCIRDGIRILGTAPDDGHYVDDLTISECAFYNCGRSGITCQRAFKNTHLVNNLFELTNDQGIDFEPTATGAGVANPKQIVITGNIIRDTVENALAPGTRANAVTLSGVSVTEPNYQVIFSHNIVRGTVQGLRMSNMIITDNIFDGSDALDAGVSPLAFSRSATTITLRGNIITGNGAADCLTLSVNSSAAPDNWTITDNIFYVPSARNGIAIDSGTQMTICNNRIICATNDGASGISLVTSVDNFKLQDCVVSGNFTSGFTNGIFLSTGSGGAAGAKSIDSVLIATNSFVHRGAGGKKGITLGVSATHTLTNVVIANNQYGTGISTPVSGASAITGQVIGGWGFNQYAN